MDLTPIEKDFIEFVANQKKIPLDQARSEYIQIRKKFDFGSDAFKDFSLQIYHLFSLWYRDQSDAELISSYQHHGLMHLYRFLSYETVGNTPHSLTKKIKTAIRLLREKRFQTFLETSKNRIAHPTEKNIQYKFDTIAATLLSACKSHPNTIVDYGCGPAYTSFRIAQLCALQNKSIPKIVLVDIDALPLAFVQFRFNKYKFPFETIIIESGNMYPQLPPHDLCIATEVLEHVPDALRVVKNIDAALSPSGLLYGSIDDHAAHTFHISPDLSSARAYLLEEKRYERIEPILFCKTSTEVSPVQN